MQIIDVMAGDVPRTLPPKKDPNEANQSTECKVFKLNPDGSKGPLLRTMPGYPEGWDTPRKIIAGIPGNGFKKEERSMYKKFIPMPEDFAKIYEENGGKINTVAKHYGVSWPKVRDWAIEAGKMQHNFNQALQPEPTKNAMPPQGPDFSTDIHTNLDPNIKCGLLIAEPEPTLPLEVTAEIERLKLDFANLVLASVLSNTWKLKIIEWVIRL
jgi:hypothetical protein